MVSLVQGSNMKRRMQEGVTLVELMIALAVIVTILTVGVPALQNMTQNNRLTTETNRMLGNLMLARSEAVKRQLDVAVCLTSGAAVCAGTWTNTDIVVVVNDEGDDDDFDDADTMLRQEKGPSDAGSPSGQTWSGATQVVFTASGMTDGGAAVAMELADARGKKRCIAVAVSGRASVVDCP